MISTQAGQDKEDFGSEEEVTSANEKEDVIDTLCDKESEKATGKAKSLNPSPRFVDNKRENMKNSLSASEIDQVYLSMEKQELKLKQNIVEQLATATRESNNATRKISQSIESVGKSISDGLFALARSTHSLPGPAALSPTTTILLPTTYQTTCASLQYSLFLVTLVWVTTK